jgi:prolipoprotein diacylglyceryltransferase
VSYGIVFTVLGGTAVSTRINEGPMGSSLDAAALVLPLILAFTRIGCILNGCCYGLPTDGPLGVYLPDVYGEWVRRYPTQWMLLGMDIILFAGLWLYRKRGSSGGKAAIAFLFWFGLGRLLIDPMRDLPPSLWGLSFHQLSDLVILLTGAGLWLWRGQQRHSSPR